ncbi:MAG: glycosyltransferase family 4 protein, partial [Dichotomicrobium sp.]
VLQVMPPGKHFGPQRATSIDLDTRDFVRFSRYADTTTVVADAVDPAFDGVNISRFPDGPRSGAGSPVEHVAQLAAELDADVIVVQQRLPLAAQIARAVPRARVVLHTHNFQKSFADRPMVERALRRGYRRRLYRELDGIIHVSAACARDFNRHWLDVGLPSVVVGNGLDFSEWTPRAERAPEILCVARFTPEKGVLEAAQAVTRILSEFPHWRARFILSEVGRQPRYWAAFNRVLNGLGGQVSVETDRPYAEVRQAHERAAIALVPSKWIEPFGRTALEAHAGGAALISSGTGGLSEISGDTALTLPEVTSGAIEAAVKSLLSDEMRRARLARAGAARAREMFDIRVQAARLDQFLGEIVGQSGIAYRK